MNHEWTQMDTNGTTKYRSGTTKNTKYTKKEGGREYESRMDTNVKDRGNHEKHERHENRMKGERV